MRDKIEISGTSEVESITPSMPPSVASNTSSLIGLMALSGAVFYLATSPAQAPIAAASILVAAYAVSVGMYELLGSKVHRRKATGLDWSTQRPANPGRVAVKLLGLAIVLAAVIGFHAIFRFYPVEKLLPALITLLWIAPIAGPSVLLYFWIIDRRMIDPRDGYWQLGALIALKGRTADWAKLKDFALGWTVKGIFLPIMFNYLAANMPNLSAHAGWLTQGPVAAVAYLSQVMVVMELTIAVVGYTMTARLFDAHIRSTNPFLFAWVVTLVCYEPLNQIVTSRIFNYHTDRTWDAVITEYPVLFWPWLGLILCSFFVWLWATAIFGLRWSNLTNRGIITNGPYAFCKHPDYISKSVFFWLTAAPFLTAFTFWQGLTASLGLVVVNLIYLGRAKAEERHLSEDPAYVQYALAMNTRSIFRPLSHLLPGLTYQPPAHLPSQEQPRG